MSGACKLESKRIVVKLGLVYITSHTNIDNHIRIFMTNKFRVISPA